MKYVIEFSIRVAFCVLLMVVLNAVLGENTTPGSFFVGLAISCILSLVFMFAEK